MNSTSLTIERYAEIRAEMEAGKLRDEVLARAGVSMDAWTAEQRHWLQKMSAELERGRFELTNRYTQAFLDRQSALSGAEKDRIDAPAESPSVPPTPPRVPEPVFAPPEEKNSVALASVDLSRIAWVARLPADTDIEATLPPIVHDLPPKVLPFQPGAAPPERTAAPPLPTRTAQPVRDRLTETMHDDSADEAGATTLSPALIPARPALPFQPRREDEDKPEAKTTFARPVASPPERHSEPEGADLAGMTMLGAPLVPRGPALPFATTQDAGRAADEDDSDSPTLPPPAGGHSLTLEAHASLCAELARFPRDTEKIFARYGLASLEKRRAVDEAWKERLRQEPRLYQEWQQLYRRFFAR
ncbi:hypothetical protein KEG38_24075 [Polyangium jinanense]|uniref:hypothetical protein n=1 Tax=Polyangium jinanense TaxID=2829994 RepID=UPI002342107D|nr:hypothetical protein [Polyangium jinanense]MDC3956960.1 hypothetical protein [Polyangium jinanense]